MLLDYGKTADAQRLVRTLGAKLYCGDMQAALAAVREQFTIETLVEFLASPCRDVRKVSAMALAIAGDSTAVRALAAALHDSDDQVAAQAEQALWSIWFRSGKGAARTALACGCNHMAHRNFDTAIEKFSWSLALDGNFAEAHNQRAIAYFLQERYEEAIADCRAALQRIPEHFGAMAGMGHGHAQLGRYTEARRCYADALLIHPRLEGIQTSLGQVEQLLACGAPPSMGSKPR